MAIGIHTASRSDGSTAVRSLWQVHHVCTARTNIDIDDRACAEVMRRYQLTTKRAAINFALRTLAAEPASVDEARSLRGSGWDGDLDSMRSERRS